MDRRRLGKDGPLVSAVGLGCVTFGREISERAAFDVMDRAFDHGITLFDTAAAYGGGASERIVGRWLAARGTRDRVVLATKVACPLTRRRVVESARASLRRLGVERVDIFQLHRYDPDTPLEDTLAGLQEALDSGLARWVGCCNFDAAQLRRALNIQARRGWRRMTLVQCNYNLAVRDIERGIMPLCRRSRIGLITYSPLGAGFLTGKYSRTGPVPKGARFDVIPGHRDIYFTEERFQVADALRGWADERGEDMAAIALRWVFGRSGIASVLIGARNARHVDQALAAWANPLRGRLRAAVSRLGAGRS